jgi:hypothetical protein
MDDYHLRWSRSGGKNGWSQIDAALIPALSRVRVIIKETKRQSYSCAESNVFESWSRNLTLEGSRGGLLTMGKSSEATSLVLEGEAIALGVLANLPSGCRIT